MNKKKDKHENNQDNNNKKKYLKDCPYFSCVYRSNLPKIFDAVSMQTNQCEPSSFESDG